MDRDYNRTEREISEAVEKARQASEALRALTQDLDAFNLEHYRTLQGHFRLADLRAFAEVAIPRLGGAVLPDGEFLRIETPEVLRRYPNVAASYRDCTFDRKLGMRRRKAQLLGLGHPLVDAIITHFHSPTFKGDVTSLPLPNGEPASLSVRLLLNLDFEDGRSERLYKRYVIFSDSSWEESFVRFDLDVLLMNLEQKSTTVVDGKADRLSRCIKPLVATLEAEIRARMEGLNSIRTSIIGLAGLALIP